MRVPERYYPGKFDLWGNSHNIWHFFVVAAAIWHYVGALNAYHLRQVTACPAGN
jgi:adiponectin receptor